MIVDLLAVEQVLALVAGLDPGDRLDQRRLAGAVVADERDDLTGVDLEVDVGERLHGAEALRHSLGLEERAHRGRVLGRGAGASSSTRRSYWMPYFLQAAAYAPVQISLGLPEAVLDDGVLDLVGGHRRRPGS